jgi:hypothetical protein
MTISTVKIPASIDSEPKWNSKNPLHKRVERTSDWGVLGLISFNGHHSPNTATKSNGNPNEEIVDPVMVLLWEEASVCQTCWVE